MAEINRSISLLLILGFEHFVQCHKCSPRLRFVIGEAVVKKLLVEQGRPQGHGAVRPIACQPEIRNTWIDHLEQNNRC